MLLARAQLRQLEMQLEQEFEEKQMVLHEKQDLEGLIGTLCEQVGIWSLPAPGRWFMGLPARRKGVTLILDMTLHLECPHPKHHCLFSDCVTNYKT